MGLKKLIEKVADYNERLQRGKASKIKPSDVQKVLTKLHKKKDELEVEITSSKRADKTERLKTKLGIVTEQIKRAEWLVAEID